MNIKMLTYEEIAAKLGYKPNYVRDKIVTRIGFPRPAVEFSQKARKWLEADIDSYIESERKRLSR